jgi:REP element-mobilizing transposase RayT
MKSIQQKSGHTEWDCKYHIVWIPKYRKKKLYKELRQYLGEMFRDLALQKECRLDSCSQQSSSNQHLLKKTQPSTFKLYSLLHGQNPSLVEAMYMELPVFAFDINYNRATTEDQAYYFHDAHDLAKLLKGISSHKINLQDCAKSMKKIAEKRYRWKIVADQYAKVFVI